MANDVVTLYLSGDVTLSDLSASLVRLKALLEALTAETAAGDEISWVTDDLERSSALTAFRGKAADPERVERVTKAYIEVGKALQDERPIPYSPRVQTAAHDLIGILNGRVDEVRFETADGDASVTSPSTPPLPVSAEAVAYGAVEGRIQTLSNRGSLRFTLYDTLHDKAVSCYLIEGQQEIMRDAWGKLAIVEGWVRRDPRTGRPLTVRQVSAIHILPEAGPGEYRSVRGVIPLAPGSPLPEETIRRLRDA